MPNTPHIWIPNQVKDPNKFIDQDLKYGDQNTILKPDRITDHEEEINSKYLRYARLDLPDGKREYLMLKKGQELKGTGLKYGTYVGEKEFFEHAGWRPEEIDRMIEVYGKKMAYQRMALQMLRQNPLDEKIINKRG